MNKDVEVEQGKFWKYEIPLNPSKKSLLLTTTKIAILGNWATTEGVIAYYPLPDRNKKLELKLKL